MSSGLLPVILQGLDHSALPPIQPLLLTPSVSQRGFTDKPRIEKYCDLTKKQIYLFYSSSSKYACCS